MNRQRAPLTAVVALLFLSILSTTSGRASAQQTERRPNVLLIMVDDLRPEIGAYHSTLAITPNIDRLAAEGLLFERAYTQQAVCAPSRAALLSGLRPDSTGIYDLNTPLRSVLRSHVTLPQHFRNHGYTTVPLGKVYHHRNEDPQAWSEPDFLPVAGWDEHGHGWRGRGYLDAASWREVEAYAATHPGDSSGRGPAYEAPAVPDSAYPDGKIASRAIEQLRRLKEQPFFLAVGFTKPHLPFNAPRKYWDLYSPEQIRLPDNYFKPENVTEYSLANFGELRAYTDMPGKGPIPDAKARELIRGYLAATSYVDAQIGRVLAELDRLDLEDNTIVVLWGDHGYKLGEHAEWVKHTNFEIDTRTPLIVRAPRMVARGRRTRAFVEAVDLYPTLSELAGLPEPRHQGLSFAPLLRNPDEPWKTAAFSQYPRGRVMGHSIRTDRFRYTEWRDTRSGQVMARELYDHVRDPGENINVTDSAAYAAELDPLSRRLSEGWRAALPAARDRR
jgi:iduronate 2-sulfatase